MNGSQGWFIFRASDATNYWRVGYTSSRLTIQKVVSGAVSVTTDLGANTNFANAVLEVRAVGSAVRLYADGSLIFDYSDAPTTSQTKVGLQASGSTSVRWSELFAIKDG